MIRRDIETLEIVAISMERPLYRPRALSPARKIN